MSKCCRNNKIPVVLLLERPQALHIWKPIPCLSSLAWHLAADKHWWVKTCYLGALSPFGTRASSVSSKSIGQASRWDLSLVLTVHFWMCLYSVISVPNHFTGLEEMLRFSFYSHHSKLPYLKIIGLGQGGVAKNFWPSLHELGPLSPLHSFFEICLQIIKPSTIKTILLYILIKSH